MTAQQLFDAALADEAVRAKLNRLAAESEGWEYESVHNSYVDWEEDRVHGYTKCWHKEFVGCRKTIPDYTRSLDAAARLKLPDVCVMRTWRKNVRQAGSICGTVSIDHGSPAKNNVAAWVVVYTDPETEALARTCCIAAAKGWEI